MEEYKKEFIEFLVKSDALKFGEFTLKSGRKAPYFINTGMFKTGDALNKLGEYYGDKEIISIPWSGGKDSSGLLALSALYYPEKTFELLTVVNGLFKPETIPIPKKQVNTILNHLGIDKKDIKVNHH